MESTRVTVTFTLPQTSLSLQSPRDRFWADLTAAVREHPPGMPFFPGDSPDQLEDHVYEMFGRRLSERLESRLRVAVKIEVVRIRYGSALLDLDIYGLGAALKAVGVDEEFFVAMLERYSPGALTSAAYGVDNPAGTGLTASAEVAKTPHTSKLLNALSGSLLAPVLLALLVFYVGFVEMHDQKIRYLQQDQVLMDHYQAEIASLTRMLDMRQSGAGTVSPSSNILSQPVPPPARHVGLWIILADVLFLGAGLVVLSGAGPVWLRIAAAGGMLAGGAAAQGHAYLEIKSFEVNIDTLFKYERNQSPGTVTPGTVTTAPKPVASLGPELLMNIQGFVKGESEFVTLGAEQKNVASRTPLKEAERDNIQQKVCAPWRSRNPPGQRQGMLLVLGGTDTLRLGGAKGIRFESNFGLAQARAEAVKDLIVQCGVDENHVLAMVFGPQHTPELTRGIRYGSGYSDDRRVQVWALWAWPGIG